MNKEEYVTKIVQMEWMAFDQVRNKGGRASCQNDWDTFSIMRRSQYQTWEEELLDCYYHDLVRAEEMGRNLIMEKYARMMESTSPEEYKEFEGQLPKLSSQFRDIVDQIVAIQVEWMEDFASRYPGMAGQARSIRSSQDTIDNTSYETYLRGELSTYSDETLLAYGRFVAGMFRRGENLADKIMEQTAHLYGYETLEQAERSIAQGTT